MRLYIALLALLTLFAALAPGQTPVSQIFGVVRDTSGAVIPNATVVVEEAGTGQRYQAVTNAEGDFLVRALPPGKYSVSADFQGFKKTVRRGLTVTALENVRVDLVLEVGSTAQSVVVTRTHRRSTPARPP